MRIGDSRIMLHDTMMGGKGPQATGGSPASLWVFVEDADALFNRAVAAGAQVASGPMGAMADQFWGDRCGMFTDPHGYGWTIATRKEDLTPQEMEQRQAEWTKPLRLPVREQTLCPFGQHYSYVITVCDRAAGIDISSQQSKGIKRAGLVGLGVQPPISSRVDIGIADRRAIHAA